MQIYYPRKRKKKIHKKRRQPSIKTSTCLLLVGRVRVIHSAIDSPTKDIEHYEMTTILVFRDSLREKKKE